MQTIKIGLFGDDLKGYLIKLTEEKQWPSFTNMEDTLFCDIQQTLKDNGVNTTPLTSYFLVSKYFKTHFVKKWDKTKYGDLNDYVVLKSIIDSNKFKIETLSE